MRHIMLFFFTSLIFLLTLFMTSSVFATNYTYMLLDIPYPSVTETVVFGLNNGGIAVGTYLDAQSNIQGFFLPIGQPRQMLVNVAPQAISNTGSIVGTFHSPSDIPLQQGFLIAQGTFHRLHFPALPDHQTLDTEAFGINDSGTIIVGDYRDQADMSYHGFRLFVPTTNYKSISYDGAVSTTLAGINNLNTMVGSFTDSAGISHGFLRAHQVNEEILVPPLSNISFVGITDAGAIAGNALVLHVGFVLHNGMTQLIQFPAAQATELEGIRNDGVLYGSFLDAHGIQHGFLAIPDDTSILPSDFLQLATHSTPLCLTGSKHLLCK